jgi:phospholipid/cholesterol/gamma-HCH transport system permease protein
VRVLARLTAPDRKRTAGGGEQRDHDVSAPPHSEATIPAQVARRRGIVEFAAAAGRGRRSLPEEGYHQMVRSVADRAFLPTRNLLEEVGDMMILTGKTVMSALRPPYPYGEELVSQFLFALRLCWFPLLISTVAFNYAAPGLQAANFLTLFGSLDRLGGFFVLAAVREIGPYVDAIVLAGVAGTAITADLGARKIREELDALQVLGVDPVKNLVVPRFLALMLVTGLFDVYAVLFGIFGGVLVELVNGQPVGPFWDTLFANASTTDLWGSVLKTMIFGAIIAIVCCYKGMTASGGAEGVGRAVNQAVVLSFLAFGAFNYVFTQTLLATHPEIIVIK